MSGASSDISRTLRVAAMCPLDSKSIFETLEELINLGEDNNLAFTYYEGMRTFCLEDRKEYEWKELAYGETGIVPSSFVYPPDTIVNEKDYSAKTFNFVAYNNNEIINDFFYVEPSVNIEIKDNPTILVEAFHFGNMDIGAGLQDVALIKQAFSPQSGYDIKSTANIGDEIKMYNATTKKYLGHFILADTTYSGYYVMTIVEKGDWSPEGVFPTQKIVINLLRETNYSISLFGSNILLKRGTQQVGSVDLQSLLGGAVGSTITSGVLNPTTGMVTFTMSDSSTFDVDFSALINAEDFLDKSSILSVKSQDVYQNLYVTKATFLSYGKGFYSADLGTNYNTTTFAGFPYPANRDYAVCLYSGNKYLLVKKNDFVFRRLAMDPNSVIGMCFYKYRDTTKKSMEFLAYMKVLTRMSDLVGLNANYYALPIYNTWDSSIPFDAAGGSFDETKLRELNESQAYCFITHISNERLPLRKDVTAPYTITETDNGRILHISGSGNLTVPKLNYGFECGMVQVSTDLNEITIIAGSGVTLNRPSAKTTKISGQWYTAYLISNELYVPGGVLAMETDNYILSGDLKEI